MIFDVASAIDQGKRNAQEDALAYGIRDDDAPGFIVLADGMGGHVNGGVASGLVVNTVHETLSACFQGGLCGRHDIQTALRDVTHRANASIATYVKEHRAASGMGTTLVVPVVSEGLLHWASVGDSPLYLFRGGDLRRINEDHSLAPQLDFLASAGLMDAETARTHPDRGALTSALSGQSIPKIDCGMPPVALMTGDIIVASSDGLLFLSLDEIREILRANEEKCSSEITDALMKEIRRLDHPAQDNVSLVVVKVTEAAP